MKSTKDLKANIFNEWGTLREVVVGTCFNISDINVDTSFRLFFLKNIEDQLIGNSIKLQRRLVEQRQEDLDGLAETLKAQGIIVHRPKKLELVQPFKTPNFEDVLCPVDNPRDQSLIIGNEIIETSCQWRRRYFENDLMKDIFYKYFRAGAKWSSAPRPMMSDENFDFSNMPWEEDSELRQKVNQSENLEIMFDGAQCLHFGKDIVFNLSTKNHELGADWLERHLGDEYNIHRVKITDHHIDGMFMPLRPGVLLVNPLSMGDKLHLLPEKLQRWDILKVPFSHDDTTVDINLASANINVNVLPLSEKKVLLFSTSGEEDTPFAEMLVKNGFEPITVRLRHSRMFGGGLHCATLDMNRDGELTTYF